MVVALRYIFTTLWYCFCVLSCINTHHFVYTSLSQTLYPSIIGLSMVVGYAIVCICKKRIPKLNGIQILTLTLIAYMLLHDTFIQKAELYKQGYTISTLLLMVVLIDIARAGFIRERHLTNGILLICTINIVYLVAQSLGFMDSDNPYFTLTGVHENPNIAAMPLCICIPFIIHKIANKSHIALALLMLILIVVFIVAIKCRTSFVGVGCLFICWIATISSVRHFFRRNIKSTKGIVTIACISAMAFALCTAMYKMKKDSADGRLFIYQRSCEMIASMPMGCGYGRYEAEYNLFQSRYFASHKEEYANSILSTTSGSAYNDFIEQCVQGGPIGGILYLALLILAIFYAYRQKNHICGFAMVAILVMSMTNSICYSISPWIMTITIVALVAKDSKEDKCMSGNRWLVLPILLLGMSVSLLYRNIQFANSQKQFKQLKDTGNKNINDLRALYPSIGTSEAYWTYTAECNEETGDFISADSCYTEARKYTSAPLLLYKSAICKENMGEKTSAVALMKTAICMLPRNFSLKYYLMMMYCRMNDMTHAKEIAAEILDTPIKKESDSMSFILHEAEHILNE